MKNSTWSIILLWAMAQLSLYVLAVFEILKSFQSGGYEYYLALFALFIILFYSYYYSSANNWVIRIRSFYKPMVISILLLGGVILGLSLLFPEIFKTSELGIYRRRIEMNGYSPEDVQRNMAFLEKFYLLLLFLGSFITNFIIGSITLLIFKVISKIKKKTISNDINL